jgi:methionyl-tRNA formyltransferase
LHDELAALGAKLMIDVLKQPESAGTPQPAESVTYAKKIDKAETKIDFTKPAAEVRHHIHGLSPFPGAWCILAGSRVKILKAQAVDHVVEDALTFTCGSGAIKFLSLQREGKAVMDADTFIRGFPIAPGTKPA